jgi:uncharacterized membrane protein HdeD (DUF308 family)
MSEIADFRAALREAGQPWSGWGVRIVGVGILALLALQIKPNIPYAFYALLVSVAVIAVGWVMLIMAMLKRRQWAKAHPIADVPLPEAP